MGVPCFSFSQQKARDHSSRQNHIIFRESLNPQVESVCMLNLKSANRDQCNEMLLILQTLQEWHLDSWCRRTHATGRVTSLFIFREMSLP